jgi:two-component system capsular synthesis sensor histidine kinase RcsC
MKDSSPRPPSKAPSRVPGRPLRILLVENHSDTLTCIQRYLEQLGHSVKATESMHEALAVADGATFDALISDIARRRRLGALATREVRAAGLRNRH